MMEEASQIKWTDFKRKENILNEIDEERQILKRIKGTTTSLDQAQSQVQHTFETLQRRKISRKKNQRKGKETPRENVQAFVSLCEQ